MMNKLKKLNLNFSSPYKMRLRLTKTKEKLLDDIFIDLFVSSVNLL